jgi:hypothetical protein
VRRRILSLCLAAALATGSVAALGGTGATPAAAATPACTFNGSALPIITGAAPGETIAIRCTGLAPLRPHLIFQASLLIGVDPQAKALLSGDSGLSPLLFQAALATVPAINPGSIATPISDAGGNLNHNWRVPSTQPLDPNAKCPPPTQQFNSGLIGCALALVDLTTQKPVGAGSAVVQYEGYPLLPPQPTVALDRIKARANKPVFFFDAPGATTYWWVPTLAALNALLSGETSRPTIRVTVGGKPAPSMAQATPASYSRPVFTPPKIGGFFAMPKGLKHGPQPVTVTLVQPVLGGLPLVNVATTSIKKV